jgi:hypothetical protein
MICRYLWSDEDRLKSNRERQRNCFKLEEKSEKQLNRPPYTADETGGAALKIL